MLSRPEKVFGKNLGPLRLFLTELQQNRKREEPLIFPFSRFF